MEELSEKERIQAGLRILARIIVRDMLENQLRENEGARSEREPPPEKGD